MQQQDLLRNYVQRLEELPFILQRHITLLKDKHSIPTDDDKNSDGSNIQDDQDEAKDDFILELETLLFDHNNTLESDHNEQIFNLLQGAITTANKRCRISQELRQGTASAVAGLDQSLRKLAKSMEDLIPPPIISRNKQQPLFSNGEEEDYQDQEEGEEQGEEESIIKSRSISRRLGRTQSKLVERKRRHHKELKRATLRKSKKEGKLLSQTSKPERRSNRSKGNKIVSDENQEEEELSAMSEMGEEGINEQFSGSLMELGNEPREEKEGNESMPDIVCTCKKSPSGDMIACDNGPNCPIEWFHLNCVGLREAPSINEPWFCEHCLNQQKQQSQ